MKNSKSNAATEDFFQLTFETLLSGAAPKGKRKVPQRRKR
jgi:hypothetical protein